jgi:hypothetical protein
LNWQVLGLGDFAGNPNEADLIMRDSNTGNISYFDIASSQIVGAGSMGGIGSTGRSSASAISAVMPTRPT